MKTKKGVTRKRKEKYLGPGQTSWINFLQLLFLLLFLVSGFNGTLITLADLVQLEILVRYLISLV